MESRLSDRLSAFTEMLITERNRLQGEHDRLIKEREAVDADLRRVDKALAIIKDEPATPKRRKGSRKVLSDHTLGQVLDVCRELPSPFSSHDVAAELGLHKSTIIIALQTLREREEIRKAGKRSRTPLYALMEVPVAVTS